MANLDPSYALKIVRLAVREGVGKADVSVVGCRECMQVKPHRPDPVAEEIVAVLFALWHMLTHGDHGHVLALLAVGLEKIEGRFPGKKSNQKFLRTIGNLRRNNALVNCFVTLFAHYLDQGLKTTKDVAAR